MVGAKQVAVFDGSQGQKWNLLGDLVVGLLFAEESVSDREGKERRPRSHDLPAIPDKSFRRRRPWRYLTWARRLILIRVAVMLLWS